MPPIHGIVDPTMEPSLPHIVTFYSFKGGVGRTLALANTALLLAKHGRNVLVIDADLEAPGLTHVPPFDGVPEDRRGFLDILEAFLSHIPTEDGGEWVEPKQGKAIKSIEINDFVTNVPLPSGLGGDRQGRLAYIPAGSATDDYAARVDALSIGRLYASGIGQRLFQQFKAVLKCEAYDYILIDSRTGWSDIGGMCTRDLADTVVMVCGLNIQNVQGTRRVLDAIDKGRTDDLSDNVILVASPVPVAEEDLKKKRLQEMAEDLGRKPDVLLPYHSRLALEETPFVGTYDDSDLVNKYSELMNLVLSRASDSLLDLIKRANEYFNAENRDAAREALVRAGWTDKARTLSGLNQLRSVVPIVPGRFLEDRRLVHELMMSLQPDNTDEVMHFGLYLAQLGSETKQINLVREATDIFAHLAQRKSDKLSEVSFHLWGRSLSEQAQLEGDTPVARRLFNEASEKFAEAVRLKSDSHKAFNDWGGALGNQAKLEGNTPEAKRLLNAAAEKQAEAVRIKSDYHEALSNWGVTLHETAKLEGNTPEAKRLFNAAADKYAEAIRIKPDYPEVHFNLACLRALEGDVPHCVDALRAWTKTHPSPTRAKLDSEPDFDRVREAPEFVALRNSLP